MEWQQGEYKVSDDSAALDLSLIHEFLSMESYWAKGRTFTAVEESIRNSLCFGLYFGGKQGTREIYVGDKNLGGLLLLMEPIKDGAEGLNIRREMLYPVTQSGSADPIAAAEKIASRYPDGPEVKDGFVKAAYNPALDLVMMPRREAFASAEEYYSTFFHELTHSTGNKERLNRDSLGKIARFTRSVFDPIL